MPTLFNKRAVAGGSVWVLVIFALALALVLAAVAKNKEAAFEENSSSSGGAVIGPPSATVYRFLGVGLTLVCLFPAADFGGGGKPCCAPRPFAGAGVGLAVRLAGAEAGANLG